jgi:hypothetical protein
MSLRNQYQQYVRLISGTAERPDWAGTLSLEGRAAFRDEYLPYLVLTWGGDLVAMFPETCRRLAECGVALESFVPFFYSRPRTTADTFDYFRIKLSRFREFVEDRASSLPYRERHQIIEAVAKEAEAMLSDYSLINEDPPQP